MLKAIRLNPRDPNISVAYLVLGRAYFAMKNYDEAILWLRKSVAERTVWFSRAHLVSAFALTGNGTDAAAALKDFNNKLPGYTLDAHSRDLSRGNSQQASSV